MKFTAGDQRGAKALFEKALAKASEEHPVAPGLRRHAGPGRRLRRRRAAARTAGRRTPRPRPARGPSGARKNDKALATLTQLQRAPDDVRASSAYLLGQLAEMLGKDDEALKWYDQVGDDDDHAFDAELRSARAAAGQGSSAEAHELLAQMQTELSRSAGAVAPGVELDAELYMREQHYAQAERRLQSRIAGRCPTIRDCCTAAAWPMPRRARSIWRSQDFQHLLKIKPDDVDASNALGYTLADAESRSARGRALDRAARAAKPDDPAIADSWGWLQYRLGHLDQAGRRCACVAARKDADIGVHLGEVLWKQGHHAGRAARVRRGAQDRSRTAAACSNTLKRLQSMKRFLRFSRGRLAAAAGRLRARAVRIKGDAGLLDAHSRARAATGHADHWVLQGRLGVSDRQGWRQRQIQLDADGDTTSSCCVPASAGKISV